MKKGLIHHVVSGASQSFSMAVKITNMTITPQNTLQPYYRSTQTWKTTLNVTWTGVTSKRKSKKKAHVDL